MRGGGAGQEEIWRRYRGGVTAAALLVSGAHHVADNVAELVGEAPAVASLELELDSAVVGPAALSVLVQRAVGSVVVWPPGYVGERSGRQRRPLGHVPDVGRRLLIESVRHSLMARMVPHITEPHERVCLDLLLDGHVP